MLSNFKSLFTNERTPEKTMNRTTSVIVDGRVVRIPAQFACAVRIKLVAGVPPENVLVRTYPSRAVLSDSTVQILADGMEFESVPRNVRFGVFGSYAAEKVAA